MPKYYEPRCSAAEAALQKTYSLQPILPPLVFRALSVSILQAVGTERLQRNFVRYAPCWRS